LICTTNQVKELDRASIRRFSHKIGFNYLNPKGNIIFYKKILCPLLKTDLDKKHENSLQSIKHLAPGDFKTVRNNFSFYPSKDLKHELLISALSSEVKFKKNVAHENQKIGF
jgi:transitional endoplasmic reticulum ATPase